MTKNRELVHHLADLVCLKITDGEAAELEQDLADIRSLVDRVRRMELPPEAPSLEAEDAFPPDVLRKDQVEPARYIRLEEQSKHVTDGFLVVPPVLGEDT